MGKYNPLSFVHKHVGFDVDGTLTPMNFPDLKEPFPWVKPLFKTLSENGYVIWVFSARFNADFYGKQTAMKRFIECGEWFKQYGLYDFVKLSPYKPPADIIFDDCGCTLEGGDFSDVQSALNKLEAISNKKIKWPKELLDILNKGSSYTYIR